MHPPYGRPPDDATIELRIITVKLAQDAAKRERSGLGEERRGRETGAVGNNGIS